MQKAYKKALIIAGVLAVLSAPAYAATPAEQIVSAIAVGNYGLVESIVKLNPGSTGHAENTLLTNVYGNVVPQPQGAAKAMSTASVIAPGITPTDAKPVAEGVRKIVKLIADKALLVCNPETNANTGDVQTPADPKKVADAKAVSSVLESAQEIAKMPAIVAVDPQLFSDIDAMMAACETGEEALLAQLPGSRPRTLPPHLIPPPFPPFTPPPTPASPN